MERVLSQDERIRRAEEIYARRRMQTQARSSATVNVEENQEQKITKKLIIQFMVCLSLYGAFFAMKNLPNIVSPEVMYKISDILEYDINIQELSKNINSFINKEAKKTENKENEFVEETLSATDSPEQTTETLSAEQENTAQPEETAEAVEETTAQVDISTLTPMEVNALFVKTNYSLIKPLEGEITSRFGHREPTVPTVPKNHTGIDIAEDIGKIIVASMEGDVTLVSSEGDYGNHIKITNGEVTTLYAHCSKIYVKEGEHIVQGQQIAEVGATGNVTGPHLHFEIRRNNEYIDPDLVLQF